jgi:hypothetical protein
LKTNNRGIPEKEESFTYDMGATIEKNHLDSVIALLRVYIDYHTVKDE